MKLLLSLATSALLATHSVVYGRSLLASASSSSTSTAVATNGGTAVSTSRSTAQAAGNASANSASNSDAVADGAGSLAVSNADSTAQASAAPGESNDATSLANSVAQALGVRTTAYSNSETLAQALAQRVQLPYFVAPVDPALVPAQPQVAGTQSDPAAGVPLGLLHVVQFLDQIQGQVAGEDSECPQGFVESTLSGVPVYLPQSLDQPKCLAAFENLCDSIVDQIVDAIRARTQQQQQQPRVACTTGCSQ